MDDTTPATSAAVGVVVALREHWSALDHDFRHHYGLDLDEACYGPAHLGVRRLYDYIARLPSTSEFAREGGWSWDESQEMGATSVELLHAVWDATAATASAMTNGKYKGPKKPLKWPRPTPPQVETPKPELSREGMRALLMGGGV